MEIPHSPETSVGAEYSSGRYFTDQQRHQEDADFKAAQFAQLWQRFRLMSSLPVHSYYDVGCGSGAIVVRVHAALERAGCRLTKVKGYDVSPHVCGLTNANVTYVHGDFSQADDCADLVTLFDVIEHIPGPLQYLAAVGERCQVLALHIPLDYSLNTAWRNLFRAKLQNPGHLLFLDAAAALNLLTLAGLRVVDYEYTFAFAAPSGRQTWLNRLVYPLRWALAHLSPWLLSKLLGGASLLVIALTPQGVQASAAANQNVAAK